MDRQPPPQPAYFVFNCIAPQNQQQPPNQLPYQQPPQQQQQLAIQPQYRVESPDSRRSSHGWATDNDSWGHRSSRPPSPNYDNIFSARPLSFERLNDYSRFGPISLNRIRGRGQPRQGTTPNRRFQQLSIEPYDRRRNGSIAFRSPEPFENGGFDNRRRNRNPTREQRNNADYRSFQFDNRYISSSESASTSSSGPYLPGGPGPSGMSR